MSDDEMEFPNTLTPTATLTPNFEEIRIAKPWGRLVSCSAFIKNIDLIEPSMSLKLGRSENCEIIIRANTFTRDKFALISKEHFRLTKEPGEPMYLTDLSKNGTYINRVLVGKNRTNVLKNDDIISIGYAGLQVYIFKKMESQDDVYLPVDIREKYEISTLLGRGACGEVRLAYDRATCKKYAIKKVIKASNNTSQINQLNHPSKIQMEINILRSIYHPCVIYMKEIVDLDTEVFMVLEYMEGGELTKRIFSEEPLTESNVKLYFYQIVLAVQYLHSRGITHRDIKAENILLHSNKTETLVKVSDFGLSKENNIMQTVCGTLNYVAPEIINGKFKEYNNQVDVWSLGVLLYFMLSKDMPFKSLDRPNLTRKIISGVFEMAGPNWKGVSYLAKDIIKGMLTVNPKKRMSIDQILRHPWLKNDNIVKSRVTKIIKNYKREVSEEPELKRRRIDES